jgi:hypothetical protein
MAAKFSSRRKKLILALIILLVLLLAVYFYSKGKRSRQLVGGDRDVHGCIPSAGYSWCEAEQKCLRIWEESCPGE